MTPDDTPEAAIPEDDGIARAARRGLGAIADGGPAHAFSWPLVQTRARRVQRRRLAAVGGACAIVLLGAGGAVAAVRHDNGRHVNIAGGVITPSTPATTTTVPPSYGSSSAPPLIIPAPGTAGTTAFTTAPQTTPPASEGLLDGKVTGSVTVNGKTEMFASPVLIGSSADVTATIRNVSDHAIWTSSSLEPTSLATICTSNRAETSRSLWWMTNTLLAPGESAGRSGTFEPTDAYSGTVTCELDLVTTNGVGTTFDTSAGGDEATATIIGRCPTVSPAIFDVYVTTTTIPYGSTTTIPADTTIPDTTIPGGTTTSAP